ncbi:hypothetical protein [Ralstonia pseudosolanacearum]|uniref:hypothetical protein n=1 Tax=Ralstonia pseudosolanacearum TaxID=1310165 RepID=UPI003CF1EE79
MAKSPLRTERIEILERKTREIGWFPEVQVQFSYWHGGRLLKEGSTFCWPNESVLKDVQEEGERVCSHYGIGPDSSLELIAFRCDREVVKVQSSAHDKHWQYPESDRGLPRSKLISCSRIWSSKTGNAPALASWNSRKVAFTKLVPIAGESKEAQDLTGHFNIGLKPIDQVALSQGLAIGSGAFHGLEFHNICSDSADYPGRFAKMSGSITIATDPRVAFNCDEAVLELVRGGVEVEAWPNGSSVHWDSTRLHLERTSWALG